MVHYSVVLPFLQSRSQIRIGSWLFNIWHGKDLEKYGELCLKEGESRFWYNALRIIDKFLLVWMFGWLVFMLILWITE